MSITVPLSLSFSWMETDVNIKRVESVFAAMFGQLKMTSWTPFQVIYHHETGKKVRKQRKK